MSQPTFTAAQFPAPECYRHPGRTTYIRCQRCGRPICPECMVTAAVGFQCPDCVASGARATRQNRAPFGGLRSAVRPTTTTVVLIAINVVVWGLISLTGGQNSKLTGLLSLSPASLCLLASDPTRYLQGATAAVCAATQGMVWTPSIASGAYWQVLTSAFAHVDILHIGFNMVALWFIGPSVERAIGRTRFLAVYLLSALTCSASVVWLSYPTTSTLGASGAIFGLMGALLVIVIKVHGDVRTVLIWLGINAVYTFLGGATISWQGHLGGLIGGVVVGAIVMLAPRVHRERWQWLGFAAVAVVTVALIAARAVELGS